MGLVAIFAFAVSHLHHLFNFQRIVQSDFLTVLLTSSAHHSKHIFGLFCLSLTHCLCFIFLELDHALPNEVFVCLWHYLLKCVLEWQQIGQIYEILMRIRRGINCLVAAECLRIRFFNDCHKRKTVPCDAAEKRSLVSCTRDLIVDDHIFPLLFDEEPHHEDAVLGEVMESQRIHSAEYLLQMALLDVPHSTVYFIATPHRIGDSGCKRK